MSDRENLVEESKVVHQLDDRYFYTLGELKDAVCAAYEEFGNVSFDDGYPTNFSSAIAVVYREMTTEELEEEEKSKQLKKEILRRNWEKTARENGWTI